MLLCGPLFRLSLETVLHGSLRARPDGKAVCTVHEKPVDEIPPDGPHDTEDEQRGCSIDGGNENDGQGKVDKEDREPTPAALSAENAHLSRDTEEDVDGR